MTKQKQQQPKSEQQQSISQRGKNPDQQGGRNAQGQTGSTQRSQGQPGARQSDQGDGGRDSSGSRNQDAPKGSQRGQTANQQGSQSPDDDDESPEMNQAGEHQANARQGAGRAIRNRQLLKDGSAGQSAARLAVANRLRSRHDGRLTKQRPLGLK